MPFPSGSVSFKAYKVMGDAPPVPTESMMGQFAEHRILADNSLEESTYGWCGPTHIMDAKIDFDNCVFGEAIHIGLRVDTNKVPGDVKKALRQMEESALAAQNPSGFISKAQKRMARETVLKTCETYLRDGRYRRSKLVPVLWDLKDGILYTSATGRNLESLIEIFERTFKLELLPSSAGVVAERYAENANIRRQLEDSRPTAFVTHDGNDTPEYPWVAKGNNRYAFLGNEFLVWLWYRCEVNGGSFGTDRSKITVYLDRSLDMECAWGSSGKQTLRGDAPNRLPEAKAALAEGKVPRKAGMVIDSDGEQFTLNLNAETLHFGSVRLPDIEDADTARVVFEERITHIANITRDVFDLYRLFLKDRLSLTWVGHLGHIKEWINLKTDKEVAVETAM